MTPRTPSGVQVRALARADVLVAAHGAALTNLLWLPSRAGTLEAPLPLPTAPPRSQPPPRNRTSSLTAERGSGGGPVVVRSAWLVGEIDLCAADAFLSSLVVLHRSNSLRDCTTRHATLELWRTRYVVSSFTCGPKAVVVVPSRVGRRRMLLAAGSPFLSSSRLVCDTAYEDNDRFRGIAWRLTSP